MNANFEAIKETTRSILASFAEKIREIDAKEAEARQIIRECEERRWSIEAKRAVLIKSEKVIAAELGIAADSVDSFDSVAVSATSEAPQGAEENEERTPELDRVRPRARVGTQRYLILVALRNFGPLNIDQLVVRTMLSAKRVKDQIRADSADGVLEATLQAHAGDLIASYKLTHTGIDLLKRFEDYRITNGKTLPTHADLEQENERTENDTQPAIQEF